MTNREQRLAGATSRECLRFASLLPLYSQHLLSPQQTLRLQDHLAGCAHCRAELAAFDELDGAVRRHYSLAQSMPSHAGEIMHTIRQCDQSDAATASRLPLKIRPFLTGSIAGIIVAALVVLVLTHHSETLGGISSKQQNHANRRIFHSHHRPQSRWYDISRRNVYSGTGSYRLERISGAEHIQPNWTGHKSGSGARR